MPLENVVSVNDKGILCHELSKELPNHISVADVDVQIRRERIKIPNGMFLHQYANLYFDVRNPMLYKLKDKNDSIAILLVSIDVLNLPNVVVSDMNAAKYMAAYYNVEMGLDKISFDKVFQRDWNAEDPLEYDKLKGIKCAEVLVPKFVDRKYISRYIVYNSNAKQQLIKQGISESDIVIDRDLFF